METQTTDPGHAAGAHAPAPDHRQRQGAGRARDRRRAAAQKPSIRTIAVQVMENAAFPPRPRSSRAGPLPSGRSAPLPRANRFLPDHCRAGSEKGAQVCARPARRPAGDRGRYGRAEASSRKRLARGKSTAAEAGNQTGKCSAGPGRRSISGAEQKNHRITIR